MTITTVPTKEKLDELREKILPVLMPYGVKRIALFGSMARGEETAESDIDLLVMFEEPRRKPLSLFTWVQLEEDIAQQLGHSVEIVSEKALSRHIRPYVEKDMLVLYDAA